jgi:hypothetical protein
VEKKRDRVSLSLLTSFERGAVLIDVYAMICYEARSGG